MKNFRNEIVWCYTRHSNIGKMFPSLHDTIFSYGKTENTVFNIQKEATENQLKKYKNGYLIGGAEKTIIVYDDTNPKCILALEKYKDYNVVKSDMEGKPIPDYWNLPMLNPMAKERLGYPTQKPEALLERIIIASSNTYINNQQ